MWILDPVKPSIITPLMSIAVLTIGTFTAVAETKNKPIELFEQFCTDCHDDATQKGNINLSKLLADKSANRSIVFENLITGKMPPKKKEQPNAAQRRAMLSWLASHQPKQSPKPYRRISRHEFNQSAR